MPGWSQGHRKTGVGFQEICFTCDASPEIKTAYSVIVNMFEHFPADGAQFRLVGRCSECGHAFPFRLEHAVCGGVESAVRATESVNAYIFTFNVFLNNRMAFRLKKILKRPAVLGKIDTVAPLAKRAFEDDGISFYFIGGCKETGLRDYRHDFAGLSARVDDNYPPCHIRTIKISFLSLVSGSPQARELRRCRPPSCPSGPPLSGISEISFLPGDSSREGSLLCMSSSRCLQGS